jgi:hypothetical protein
MGELICAYCKDENDPVTTENSISIPDADGTVVLVHKRCAGEWVLTESEAEGTSAS